MQMHCLSSAFSAFSVVQISSFANAVPAHAGLECSYFKFPPSRTSEIKRRERETAHDNQVLQSKTNRAMASDDDRMTEQIIGCAIEVHRALGPGLLESAYEQCMAHELSLRGRRFGMQVPVPVVYKGLALDCAYKADLVIEDDVVVELKAVDSIAPIHQAQLLTYLKLTGVRVGLLINFNVRRLVDGVTRFRRLAEQPPHAVTGRR
jgi:GxxExxY protein